MTSPWITPDPNTTHTLSVLVENKPGVLSHVAGLFSRRAFNIASLAVGPTADDRVSRITILVDGASTPVGQVMAQLNKLVRVLKVVELHRGTAVERELALIKVRGSGADRVEALRIADIFRAHVVDTTSQSFIFELTGAPSKIDKFTDLMRPLGLVEVSRTGVLSIERGEGAL